MFGSIVAQEHVNDSTAVDKTYMIAVKPMKVAFYSTVLPGLGQAYNRDYWKIPLVYGALGAGVYFYAFNNDRYHEYRTAFKLLKLGEDNGLPNVSESTLQSAQEYHKKNRDLSLLVTAGLYVLQIVEASVDAHLYYHNTDDQLTITPFIRPEDSYANQVVGLAVKYSF